MPSESIGTALDWLAEGRRVVAATLVETLGSAPLDPGAEMLVDDSGRIEGSVTGGCVEGALVEEAQGILAGAPPRVATYGISDQQAADVGLMCGGTVKVFVRELHARDALAAAREAIGGAVRSPSPPCSTAAQPAARWRSSRRRRRRPRALALLDDNVARDALGFLNEGRSAVRRYSHDGETMGADLRVAIHAFATPPRMVIFGAIDFSSALAAMATRSATGSPSSTPAGPSPRARVSPSTPRW
jgi:xanthine dehydrogenase accessory factor